MTDEIRLLVLNCEFPPIGGGAGRATEHLLREFDGLPVRWTLVTASGDATARNEARGGRGRIDYLEIGKDDIHYWTVRELIRYAAAAVRHIRRLEKASERFDLCHAFFTVPAGAVAALGAKRRPYLVSLRGSDVPGESGRFTWFYRTFGFAIRAVWKRAAAVVANSPELADLAAQTAPDVHVKIIPNGVDTARFHPALGRERAFTVITVARLVPGKDIATAIRAFSLARAGFTRARFVIVGEGPQGGDLRALARREGVEDSVHFLSWVPWEQMGEVYRQADVFILTSVREGMSNTVLEAMASGLPVVASAAALSGIDAPGAIVVPTGDVIAAANAMEKFLGDDAARRSASEASRAAAEKYTWRAAAEGYYELYRQVLGDR